MARALIGPNGRIITAPGGRVSLAGAIAPVAGALQVFDLTNTEGAATSTGFFRLGLALEPGDVPSGQILEAEIDGGSAITVSQMQNNTWSDGSLRSCILVGNAGAFTAGQTKTINVTAATGTLGTSSISGGVISYLTGLADDVTVEITNHTGSTDNTNVGDLTFSLQTALATSSRREIQEDTNACVRVFAWQTVSPDEHLTCLWYVDVHLASDGATPIAYEATPVISQHWWVDDPFGVAMTKQERNYDAEILNGATSLVTHTGLNHAYYCQWAGLRTDDDDQHAKRFWIEDPVNGEAMPTLNVAYSTASRVKMMKAGYIPPLDLSQSYTSDEYTNTNGSFNGGNNDTLATPLLSNGNRIGINGTSGYVGRGLITDYDAKAIVLQTANRWREMRVMAQDSLAVFHHIKDHRAASGGAFNGDASMGLFPQEVSQQGAQSYTGLASEGVFITGNGGDLDDDPPNNAVNAPNSTGGFRAWDRAHHTVYGYFGAFIEGERYLADAVLDQFQWYHVNQTNYDTFFGDLTDIWFNKVARRTALSLPSTPSFGNSYLGIGQERELGWAQYTIDHAYCLLSDSNRHKAYLENHLQNTNDLMESSFGNFPASQLTTGTYFMNNPAILSTFMNSMASQCFDRAVILHEDAYDGFRQYSDLIALFLKDTLLSFPYAVRFQNILMCTDGETATQYVGTGRRYVNSGRVDIDNSNSPGSDFIENFVTEELFPQVGDRVRITDGLVDIPAEATLATEYEVISVSDDGSNNARFRISEIGAGVAEEWTPSNSDGTFDGQIILMVECAAMDQDQLGDNSTPIPNDDDFMNIAWAAVEYSYGRGTSNISSSDMATIRSFFAPKSFSDFASWAFDGDNIR